MRKKKEWTTMVFMAGDNNLSIDMAYALEKLRAEAAPGITENANLLVYYKNNTGETPAVYCDFTDSDNPVYRFENEVTGNGNGAAEPGGVESLVGFVDWCINRTGEPNDANAGRKADKYALILAGHTIGFLSFGMFEDETTNKTMTIPTLAEGLFTIKEKITGRKLSILGFDSCVMSMIEIAHQFKDVAETMIASEGGVPNAGWSYPGILTTIADSARSGDLRSIVKECTVSYIEQQSKYSIGGVSVDMAAWDLASLEGVNRAVAALAGNLSQCFEDPSDKRYTQMRRILLHARWNSQSYMLDQNVDLGDFCSLLALELDAVKLENGGSLDGVLNAAYESCLGVIEEIRRTILLSGFSGGEYQYSTGMSIFFPWSMSAYDAAKEDYSLLDFVGGTTAGNIWNRFLQKYIGEVTLREARQVADEFGPVIDRQPHLSESGTNGNSAVIHVNPATRLPANPITRMPFNPASRLPANPITRLPFNPATRLPANPITRMPFNPATRLPANPITRMPVDPATRMTGGSSKQLQRLTILKNYSSDWRIVGYTG